MVIDKRKGQSNNEHWKMKYSRVTKKKKPAWSQILECVENRINSG